MGKNKHFGKIQNTGGGGNRNHYALDPFKSSMDGWPTFEETGILFKDAEETSKPVGFIFMCDRKTKVDCYKYGVFGLPEAKKEMVKQIKEGTVLFLFDVDSRLLYGVYMSSSCGGYYWEREAFKGSKRSFPWQVRFHIHDECVPLTEDIFKPAIKENYHGEWKFDMVLNAKQVDKLLGLFQPLPPLEDRSDTGWQNVHQLNDPHAALPMSSYPSSSYTVAPIIQDAKDLKVIDNMYGGWPCQLPATMSSGLHRANVNMNAIHGSPMAHKMSSFCATVPYNLIGTVTDGTQISDDTLVNSRKAHVFSKTKYYQGNVL